MSLHIKNHSALATASFGAMMATTLLVSALYINNTNPTSAASNCNILARTISEAKCMQDMNDEVLTSMVLERQYELKDARDGKMYYVAKLKDGNVWMTQNLDFDLDENVTLTPDDTDIPANWKPSLSTQEYIHSPAVEVPLNETDISGGTEYGEGNPYEFTGQVSFDPGELYWDGEVDIQEKMLFQNSSSTEISEDEIDSYDIPHTTTSGNRHYHLGNYYNWAAAVAENDTSSYMGSGSADYSICPAGWTLPSRYIQRQPVEDMDLKDALDVTSLIAEDSVDKPSFVSMLEQYVLFGEEDDYPTWAISPIGSPLYLNLSGAISINGPELSRLSYMGFLWSNNYRRAGTLREGGDDVSQKIVQNTNLYAAAFEYGKDGDEDWLDFFEEKANLRAFSIRCVARSREAIEANWIKGDEHEIESEEEGILKIDVPEEDGHIIVLMIDDEPVSEDSGISVDFSDEEGGFIITFPSEYLDTLDEGEHVVKATFTSGRSAYARLTVSSTAVPNTGAPDTGMFTKNEEDSSVKDNSGTLIVAIATSVICFGMMTVAYRATHSKFKGF